MMLIVELVTVWCALSVALGLPLARRIRMADAAEFPWRHEDPWWVGAPSTRVSTEAPALV
ncbi:hypothetical protein [Cellulomonas sp. ATA003]|uniref:hypothetical protein n=1 Tax=Cellulomonas sp. ATA003 TaxID=3073064 RepID=UPI002873C713|nr:hypothetical protein [Cellulomonas sp. ATA003]WNB86107.1 hypothetical protein REH70_02140 [Cellulomonas sp. ATA003]